MRHLIITRIQMRNANITVIIIIPYQWFPNTILFESVKPYKNCSQWTRMYCRIFRFTLNKGHKFISTAKLVIQIGNP